jgi:hypothetical protein
MSAEGPIDLKHGVTHFTYDFPPGTEVVDPRSVMVCFLWDPCINAFSSGKEENIHYPMPSNDPADPLNWSPKWKLLTFGTLMMYVFWVRWFRVLFTINLTGNQVSFPYVRRP